MSQHIYEDVDLKIPEKNTMRTVIEKYLTENQNKHLKKILNTISKIFFDCFFLNIVVS